MKITAEQKGVLLRELLTFLLDKNGKAKREEVFAHLLGKYREFGIELREEDYLGLVETIASMCVRAEWLERSGSWKVTEHGRLAYGRFNSPEVLFQEMGVQGIFRDAARIPAKNKKFRILGFALIILFPGLCIYSGIASSNQSLFWLAIAAIFSLLISLLFYNSRTRLIILGRVLFFEYIILSVTLFLDSLFINTSLNDYFQIYYLVTLVSQGICMMAVASFPRVFSKFSEYINQSKWLFIIPTIMLVVLFGGKFGSRTGLLYHVYGKDITSISFSLVFAGLLCVVAIFVFGNIVSNLEGTGYYD